MKIWKGSRYAAMVTFLVPMLGLGACDQAVTDVADGTVGHPAVEHLQITRLERILGRHAAAVATPERPAKGVGVMPLGLGFEFDAFHPAFLEMSVAWRGLI